MTSQAKKLQDKWSAYRKDLDRVGLMPPPGQVEQFSRMSDLANTVDYDNANDLLNKLEKY